MRLQISHKCAMIEASDHSRSIHRSTIAAHLIRAALSRAGAALPLMQEVVEMTKEEKILRIIEIWDQLGLFSSQEETQSIAEDHQSPRQSDVQE